MEYSNYELLQITEEVLNQLGGVRSICIMTGAYNFKSYEEDNNPVTSFQFKASRSYNYVKITLTPMDTYKMEIGQIRKLKGVPTLKIKITHDELYCDNIKETFERDTGVYLTLFP